MFVFVFGFCVCDCVCVCVCVCEQASEIKRDRLPGSVDYCACDYNGDESSKELNEGQDGHT